MISVFKTGIANDVIAEMVTPFLNRLLAGATWSIDIEDCDHILRIVHNAELNPQLVPALHKLGVECMELV